MVSVTRREGAYFVRDLLICRGKINGLLKDVPIPIQLNCFSPVVKSAGDEHFVRIIGPAGVGQ